MGRLVSGIRKAMTPTFQTQTDTQFMEAHNKHIEAIAHEAGKKVRHMHFRKSVPVVQTRVLGIRDPKSLTNRTVSARAKSYTELDVTGSNGRVYTVAIPKGYINLIPKVWAWNDRRYKAAELLSAGYPVSSISKELGVNKNIIYGWLQHPEFKSHVDGKVLETGWANQRERIAGLNMVTRRLFDKVMAELDTCPLTDKSIGPILVAIQTIAKQIAQEKGEFVEQSRVDNNTTLSGAIGVAVGDVERLLSSKTEEERRALEGEFKVIGDDIIRGITGEKE